MLTRENLKSVKRYCMDPIDEIEGWFRAETQPGKFVLHHRLEEQGYSRKELISKGLYYNRPAEELVFLTRSEHQSLHAKSENLSKETREKQSEAKKGEKNPNYGKPAYNRIDIGPTILQTMRYEQHMTCRQIADQLGVARGTIRNKLLLLNKEINL